MLPPAAHRIPSPGEGLFRFPSHFSSAIIRVMSPRTQRPIKSRVIRPDEPVEDEPGYRNATPAERMNAVWTLTEACLQWGHKRPSELRLQRSISRIQRPVR